MDKGSLFHFIFISIPDLYNILRKIRYSIVYKRIKIATLLMILGITTCYAQYDPSFSHYLIWNLLSILVR